MQKKHILLFILVGLMLMVLAACGARQGMDGNRFGVNQNGTNHRINSDGTDNDYGRNLNPNLDTTNRYYHRNGNGVMRNDDARQLANLAENVNGVEDAAVVIAGQNAYVGINLEDGISQNQAEQVEDKVVRVLKQSRLGNYDMRITSDEDFFGRLRDMGNRNGNGTTGNNLGNKLNKMWKNLQNNR